MSKISIIGGDYIETTGGDNLLFAKGNIINFSELEVRQKGEENGVSYGQNKEAPLISRHFIEGYWTSDQEGKNKITEAELGDTVYFIVKFEELESDKDEIEFELFELVNSHYVWLGFLLTYKSERGRNIKLIRVTDDKDETQEEKPYKTEKITNKQAVITFVLSEKGALKNMLLEEKFLELFFWVKYHNEKVKLPTEKADYLRINRPKIKDGKLIFVQASNEHLLPELYDAKTGDIILMGVEYGRNITYTSKVTGIMLPKNEPNFLEKQVNKMVIGRLSKGELITNNGKITTTKRLFEKTINDLDGKFSEKIFVGANKGNFEKGVTTRGINQYEAMLQNGRTGIAMKAVKLSGVMGDLFTLKDMMVKKANGEKLDIPFMPPFITSIVANEYEEMYDDFHQAFLVKLNNTIATGNLATVEKFFKENQDQDIRKGYDLIFITDDEMGKVLDNTIKFKNELAYSNGFNYIQNNGLVVQYIESKDEYDRETYVYYVYAIFVSKILTEN